MKGGVWISIPEAVGERLDAITSDLRHGIRARQQAFERAIHAALDAERWPSGARGGIAIPCEHWFVNLRRRGELVGHVGPLPSKEEAERVARSWRQTGARAWTSRTALGGCLTNRFGGD